MAIFNLGDVVCLKSDHSIQGAVIRIIEGGAETRYVVFTSSLGKQTYYESQIELMAFGEELKQVDAARFHAELTASLIRNPSLSSLYSLNAGNIDFIPHQFRPVLKFIKSDRPRLLIADGVGVGKTIEAGLILRELKARRNLESVLVICPRPLVTEEKWETEMKRFDEDFDSLNGERFQYCLKEMDYEGEWPEKYKKAVLPYSLFDEAKVDGNKSNKKQVGLTQLDPPPKFDLVIVDAYGIIGLNSKGSANKGFLKLSPILFSPQMRLMIDLRRKHAQNEDLSAKRSAACNSGSTVSDVVPSRLLQRQSAEHTPDVDLHRSTVRYSKDVSLACAA